MIGECATSVPGLSRVQAHFLQVPWKLTQQAKHVRTGRTGSIQSLSVRCAFCLSASDGLQNPDQCASSHLTAADDIRAAPDLICSACGEGYGLSCSRAIPSGWRNRTRPVHVDRVSGAGDERPGPARRAFRRTPIRSRFSKSQPRQTRPTHHPSTPYQPSVASRLAGSIPVPDEPPSAQVAQAKVLGHGGCAGPLPLAPLFCDPISISAQPSPDSA